MAVGEDVARAIGARPLLALAVALAAALAWRVNPWALGLAIPFLAFRPTWPFLAIGLLTGAWLAPSPAPLSLERRPFNGTLTVASVPRLRPERLEFDVQAEGRRWTAQIRGTPEVQFGDELRVAATLRPLRESANDYLRLQGIEGRLEIHRWSVTRPGSAIARAADGWRRSFAAFCERWLPGDVAILTEALCLNLDGTLDDVTRNRLRATGTIHIISASGLHVFVLAGALMGVLSFLPIRREIQLIVLGALLALYTLTTGLNAPVVRSALMSMAGLAAYLFRRDRDALSALALAAVVYLLWRPRGVFEIGFQLSFITVGGLALFGSWEREDVKNLPGALGYYGIEAIRISWIAFVASAPLVAYHFGTLSLATLPANFLIAIPVSGVVVGGLAAHLLSHLSMALGVGVLQFVGSLTGYILAVLEWLGDLPLAQVDVPALPGWFVVVLYLALLLTWRERHVHP